MWSRWRVRCRHAFVKPLSMPWTHWIVLLLSINFHLYVLENFQNLIVTFGQFFLNILTLNNITPCQPTHVYITFTSRTRYVWKILFSPCVLGSWFIAKHAYSNVKFISLGQHACLSMTRAIRNNKKETLTANNKLPLSFRILFDFLNLYDRISSCHFYQELE